MSTWKSYRVTAEGKFEPLRMDLLIAGVWLVLIALTGLVWWGGYKLVMWALG